LLLAPVQPVVFGMAPRQPRPPRLDADEFGARLVAVLLEPVGVDEVGVLVLGVLVAVRLQRGTVAHGRSFYKLEFGPPGTGMENSASGQPSSPLSAITTPTWATSDSKCASESIITSCCWMARPGLSTLQYQFATLRKLRQAKRSVRCSTSRRKCRSI